ncbi:MAG: FAD-dependent oxidoreductase [Rhizobiales bacterium]|nr:FAD-dependent oxidoreductase [Hyphomicrobiales bacterium]
MPKTDVLVLGAGIVGTSVAVHLAQRGLKVILVDRQGPGEGTSYGNAGILEGNTVFPPAFPSDFGALMRIALKRSTVANYHLSFLPRVAPWLMAFRAASQPERLVETAHVMRPLFARAVAEHEALAAASGAEPHLRKTGWLKLYRSAASLAALKPEFDLAASFGIAINPLNVADALALEPSLAPVFRRAMFWPGAASIDNPLALTRAYAAHYAALGGATVSGDARTLRRAGQTWVVDSAEGSIKAEQAVVALGPWAPDVLGPLGIRLPFGIKRGYHLHYRAEGNAGLTRPVLDADVGYCLGPMQQGIRLTTGAEFAARDAAPTPVQFGRLMPFAKALFPLGEPVESQPWLGCRPCFPDSRPVIGKARNHPGLWLTIGHAHWGLTLGPATGRLIAEMLTGATLFCDPAPYRAERFD